jgi:hypothetical protein
MLAQTILGLVLIVASIAVPIGADVLRHDWNTGSRKAPFPRAAAIVAVVLAVIGVILIFWRG